MQQAAELRDAGHQFISFSPKACHTAAANVGAPSLQQTKLADGP